MLEVSPGSIFGGDYRIVKPLNQGGMGSLYTAEQISTGVLRALKLMQPQCVENPTMRRRFEQEARVSARIESDYVVAVLGAGVDEPTGVPWIAMELLQGEDLAHRVARAALSPDEVQEVFTQLCHAVAAAHDIGIVHRDLKPENIFLAKPRRPSERFTLKVLDFGIAKVVEDGRTQTGTVGTPLWMAPEQASASGRISPATDVWALGLLAFYVLTGKRYWNGANRPNTSLPILLREIVAEPLQPASMRAELLGCTQKPTPSFDEWFGRCLIRDPAQRFQHAREAFEAFRLALEDKVATTQQSTTFPFQQNTSSGKAQGLDNTLSSPGVSTKGRYILLTAVLITALAGAISFFLLRKGAQAADFNPAKIQGTVTITH